VLDVRSLLAKGEEEEEEDDGSLAPVLETDVGNLLVFDYQEQPKGTNLVKAQAERCLQHLFNKVFTLPVTKSDVGALAELRPPTYRLPREKHAPQAKEPTKWETFAKSKGIQKRKRSRMVFDDTQGEYKPRWGKDRVRDPVADSWVLPDKPLQLEKSGAQDPFEMAMMNKKESKERQKKRELANRKKQTAKISNPVTLGLSNPQGIQKTALEIAIAISQKSTASMGDCDKLHKDEPRIKRKAKYMPSELTAEQKLTMKIADRVLRDAPEMDVSKAANQVIYKQEKKLQRERAERPMKKRRK